MNMCNFIYDNCGTVGKEIKICLYRKELQA